MEARQHDDDVDVDDDDDDGDADAEAPDDVRTTTVEPASLVAAGKRTRFFFIFFQLPGVG